MDNEVERMREIYRNGGCLRDVVRELDISVYRATRLRPNPEEVYPVEHGVPLPPPNAKNSRAASRRMNFPWHALGVMDSFFVPGLAPCGLSKSLQQAARKYNHRYQTRAINGGVRIWRVE